MLQSIIHVGPEAIIIRFLKSNWCFCSFRMIYIYICVCVYVYMYIELGREMVPDSQTWVVCPLSYLNCQLLSPTGMVFDLLEFVSFKSFSVINTALQC